MRISYVLRLLGVLVSLAAVPLAAGASEGILQTGTTALSEVEVERLMLALHEWALDNGHDLVRIDATLEDLMLIAGCDAVSEACLDAVVESAAIEAIVLLEIDGNSVTLRRYAPGKGWTGQGTHELDGDNPQGAVVAVAPALYSDTEPPAVVSDTDNLSRSMLRLTPKVGAMIPRKALQTALLSTLELQVVLPFWMTTDSEFVGDRFRVVAESGYALLAQQGSQIVPGRGMSNLVQNTHLIPMRLGLLWIGPEQWTVRPTTSLSYAMLITRSEFDLGWTTQQQNDVSSGVMATLGLEATIPMTASLTGRALLEVQHCEAAADMGAIGDVGEATLSGTGVLAGFGFEF